MKNTDYNRVNTLNGEIIEIHETELEKCRAFWYMPEDITADRLYGLVKNNIRRAFVFKTEAGYIGGCALFVREDGNGHLSHFNVAPEYRNRGIGSLLIDFAEDFFKSAGVTVFGLNVMKYNTDAIRLYERKGFKYVCDKTPEKIYMAKSLTNAVIEQWNTAAEKYAAEQENSEYVDVTKRVVEKCFKDMKSKKVLDLGCGYGVYSEYFRSKGADVIGIDGSEVMIGIAEKKYPENRYIVSDFEEALPFEDDEFDLVFSNQVLMDIEKISPLVLECSRILKKGGIFWWGIVHPAFYDGVWQTDDNGFKFAKLTEHYINEYVKTNLIWGETTHFHRPLSFYLNTFAENGFILTHTDEPVSYDGINKNDDLPLFFFAEYQNGKI